MGQRADCGTVCARTSKANATGGDVVRSLSTGGGSHRGRARTPGVEVLMSPGSQVYVYKTE